MIYREQLRVMWFKNKCCSSRNCKWIDNRWWHNGKSPAFLNNVKNLIFIHFYVFLVHFYEIWADSFRWCWKALWIYFRGRMNTKRMNRLKLLNAADFLRIVIVSHFERFYAQWMEEVFNVQQQMRCSLLVLSICNFFTISATIYPIVNAKIVIVTFFLPYPVTNCDFKKPSSFFSTP